MAEKDPNGPLLDPPAGNLTQAFELLSNNTRLAILFALWKASEPGLTDKPATFSELYDGVDEHDSGNFTYHLDKLTDQFVVKLDDGYQLSAAGKKIVQAIIAGTGLDDTTVGPTRLDMVCFRCGEPGVEIQYRDGALYLTCSECTGGIEAEKFPVGTIGVWEFDRAGLSGRTPKELRAAGGIKNRHNFRMMQEGVCPACSGTVEVSLQLCGEHAPDEGKVCSNCGTKDSVRVSYTCTVCKNWNSLPVEVTVTTHPEVIAFYYDRGVNTRLRGGDHEHHARVVSHYWEMSHSLVSTDPIRIGITVPCDGDELCLTLDGDLEVIDVTEASE